jgi:hypothetical protein
MTDIRKRRQNRMYQADHRSSKRSYKTELENALLLLAWESTDLSEGQVSHALNIDRISLRMMREGAIAEGLRVFQSLLNEEPQACHSAETVGDNATGPAGSSHS